MLEAYEKQHRSIDLIKNAIEAGDRDYQRVQEMTISELNAKVNHHKSIATWASEAYGSYSHLVNVLSGVCLVGAGLTYTAIFSAVRGNVGLMCYSFSLFIVALCIFITIQSMLVWCSHLTAAPIWDPNFWELVLIFFSCLGCLAVLGAIVLLIVTVYILRFNVTPGTEYLNPNAANWDARLEFDVAPKQGAILALSFMVAGVVAFVIIGALFVAAFGIRRVVWRRSDRLSAQLKLDDMA
ncbi:hypothetical protein DL93DRAFT_132748 [Clavulina sp. PMI_390]|nr:hypothetical protein DL93DRAFT_132748 [Clavulina sp. PMI_390]